MKKVLFAVFVFAATFTASAQETPTPEEAPKSYWKKTGNISLLLNQSAFSNWVAGGSNSVAGTVGLNYDFNYAKGDWAWDNKVIAKYGLSETKDIGVRKTDDNFSLNSLLGKKAGGNWYYSFFANVRSQFANGYEYKGIVKGARTSGFFSPGYLSFGPGMLWKKSDNFKINLSPVTSKLTFVDRSFTEFGSAFGVDQGSTSNYELGFYGSVYYKTNLMENVSMENILNVYSNYLDKPQNIDINHQLNFIMQINKYLSTNLSFHTIVDDNASSRTQFKEAFGLGVNYLF